MVPSLEQTLDLPAWLAGPRSEQEVRAAIGGNFSARFVDRGCSLLGDDDPGNSAPVTSTLSIAAASFFLTVTGKWSTIWPSSPTRAKRTKRP